jgi:hypothetical protein
MPIPKSAPQHLEEMTATAAVQNSQRLDRTTSRRILKKSVQNYQGWWVGERVSQYSNDSKKQLD